MSHSYLDSTGISLDFVCYATLCTIPTRSVINCDGMFPDGPAADCKTNYYVERFLSTGSILGSKRTCRRCAD